MLYVKLFGLEYVPKARLTSIPSGGAAYSCLRRVGSAVLVLRNIFETEQLMMLRSVSAISQYRASGSLASAGAAHAPQRGKS